MTDKSYIVANDEQELNVLKKLENNGFKWVNIETLPTKFRFSESFLFNKFPYVISAREDIKRIGWSYYPDDDEGSVVYDGRKEENMTKKYKVTHEFMKWLIKWRDDEDIDATSGESFNYINDNDLENLPAVVVAWWVDDKKPIERNNRLIAIIQWLNGEDVFEVEEPHKFVVRSDNPDEDGDYLYVEVLKSLTSTSYSLLDATRFNTREEAQEWANSHQVVVEIDEDGNEVE